ncbi:hypothetical protein BN903_11 [Halorubrum sp. AJ67]|nr:hypothetical protein BN903_11 [Halorubrum sp. AJ67]
MCLCLFQWGPSLSSTVIWWVRVSHAHGESISKVTNIKNTENSGGEHDYSYWA